MPVERMWSVPEDQVPEIGLSAEGDLLIQPRVVRDDDPDALHEAVLEVLAILRRVGGTVQIASQRGEVAPNVVVTESYVFGYNSFTPLVRRLEDGQVEQHPDAEGGDDTELTADELAQHFPEGGPLAEVAQQALEETPATDAAAAEELERAGVVE